MATGFFPSFAVIGCYTVSYVSSRVANRIAEPILMGLCQKEIFVKRKIIKFFSLIPTQDFIILDHLSREAQKVSL